MFEGQRKAIDAHALEAWPDPACGAVFGNTDALIYRPVRDVEDPSRAHFRLGPVALTALEGTSETLEAIVHSHPHPHEDDSDNLQRLLRHTPSASEMREQLRLGVPFGIVVCTRERVIDRFWFGDQSPPPPLLGRPFRHGVWDCYSAVRDWYRGEHGLVLPEFPRDWNWWIDDLDMYAQGFGKVGFRIIDRDEAGPGDAALFRVRARVSNHAAVLKEGGWMFHHPGYIWPYDVRIVSRLDPLARWERLVTHWLRPPAS